MSTIITAVIIILGFWLVKMAYQSRQRHQFIQQFAFPNSIRKKLKQTYPHLGDAHIDMVLDGLRRYFIICQQGRLNMTAMPSQVVDIAWHEFILFTRGYEQFCKQAFGKFLHHTPAEAMANAGFAQQGIKRAWYFSCKQETINPKQPSRLPLLFAIDALLEIPDGFHYELFCNPDNPESSKYCASHIGCSGSSAGSSCSGGDNDSSWGSNDNGCSGGGCGGGGD